MAATVAGWLVGAEVLPAAPGHQAQLLSKAGVVQSSAARQDWTPAEVGVRLRIGDRIRTLADSRAMMQLAELGRLQLGALTTLEIQPPRAASSQATLDLKAGMIYFFTRDKPRRFYLRTPEAVAASRGTDFLTMVDPVTGRTVIVVYDGEVEITNQWGGVVVFAGEQGTVEPGQAPAKTAVIEAGARVQWWLYYPAVLDPAEFAFADVERQELAASLTAYQEGDLLEALARYPVGRAPGSVAERTYRAGLLLAVGRVDRARETLAGEATNSPAGRALDRLIAAVTGAEAGPSSAPLAPMDSASEWLALSYQEQARRDLDAALRAAQQAVRRSARFGFAWARVAELEFARGELGAMDRALERALAFTPRNAQAHALRGFVRSARGRIDEAMAAFDRALEIDPALGNAWLGRGLCRIRRGQAEAGRADLQTAAAMEPNRSVLRSYLGKAFQHEGNLPQAGKELTLAARLDERDPTPWLYAAFLRREEHRFNEAIADLERSLALSDNRGVYRSQLLLDQDRAVRGASLAAIYERAGMRDVSVREAARAVGADYANYSAHLFLANSYDALRDPTFFNLRYETPWFNELLLANLLAPVGAGAFSQSISQQEYARLFERHRPGLTSTTEVRSDEQYREIASQFGTLGRTSYALDLDAQRNEGVRPNNALRRLDWISTLKHQLTDRDMLFLLAEYRDSSAGDNFQYYDWRDSVRTNFVFEEEQKPNLVLGYHREWSPGVHTLLLGGRLVNEARQSDNYVELAILPEPGSTNGAIFSDTFGIGQRNEFEIWITELQQILQRDRHTLVAGTRLQTGQFQTYAAVSTNALNTNELTSIVGGLDPATNGVREDFHRLSVYAYYTIEPVDHLFLTAGLSYDHLTYPENLRHAPILGGEAKRHRVNPKAALVWSPSERITLRGAYTRALGGVSYDESYRLEPTSLAGFVQGFRTVIPESVVGSVSAPTFETLGGAVDFKFRTRTYLGLMAESIKSDVRQSVGVYEQVPGVIRWEPAQTTQLLDYQEQSAMLAVNQLIGGEWSLGARYRFSRAELDIRYADVASSVGGSRQSTRSDLHEFGFNLLYSHPSGFFARAEAGWFMQSNWETDHDTPGSGQVELPDDEFPLINLLLGYRFPRQRGDVTLGLLNASGEDYHLNPLNAHPEFPHERVWMARLRLSF